MKETKGRPGWRRMLGWWDTWSLVGSPYYIQPGSNEDWLIHSMHDEPDDFPMCLPFKHRNDAMDYCELMAARAGELSLGGAAYQQMKAAGLDDESIIAAIGIARAIGDGRR